MSNLAQRPSPNSSLFQRVILIILDGVGAGALPDADRYQDLGANTLNHIATAFHQQSGRTLHLPNLAAWGLGNITEMEGLRKLGLDEGFGFFGRAIEISHGKDTTSGHWEIVGISTQEAFTTFPHGFPKEVVEKWAQINQLPGVLGNKVASGTTILEELGREHVRTGKPILYTSADSVWQVAAHEQHFGLERLYTICESAQELTQSLGLARVIARPFIDQPKHPASGPMFIRTYNRKDYCQKPPRKTYLDALCEAGITTLGIGKISNIYASQGIQSSIDTAGNTHGIQVLMEQIKQDVKGLIFCNLIDFDMLYGHRRDPLGFGIALEEFDQALPDLRGSLNAQDLLIIAADHGNDPTFQGSDHTREYIPILVDSPKFSAQSSTSLGTRSSFGDLGATVAHALLGKPSKLANLVGKSFLNELFPNMN